MPTQKDFKRLVRRRMQKTGESYTAARAQLLRHDEPKPGPAPAARSVAVRRSRTPRAAKPDYAKLAGMSDAAVKKATGCTWEKWAGALDYAGARDWPHRKIAEHVRKKFGVSDWWSQTVTVGYERIAGLREIGQRRGGGYEATKSRTFPVPVAALYAAFAEARARARWLPGIALTVRKATPHRSLRITWDDGTSVEVWLTARGERRSSVQIAHRKLTGRDAAARRKAFWSERLEALRAELEA
jgi:uncharacterized protein YndB with AHSA1/START domain